MLEVGSYFHVSQEAIGRNPVRWLFDTYETVQRAKYQRSMARIAEVEVATLRALVQFHSKKKRRLPPLPTYEETMEMEGQVAASVEPKEPAWITKYKKVNRSRGVKGVGDGTNKGKGSTD